MGCLLQVGHRARPMGLFQSVMANVLGNLGNLARSGDTLPEITEQTGSARRELPGKIDSPPSHPSPHFIDEETEVQRLELRGGWKTQ